MSARVTLAAFLAVSFIIHGIALLYQPQHAEIELGIDNRNQISIYIKPQKTAESTGATTAQNISVPIPVTSQTSEANSEDRRFSTDKSAQPSVQASLREKKILGQIQQELARFFYYPPQAVRRGMQGKVILSFQLSNQGRINTVTISQSSGHTILDNAALDAFNQAAEIFTTSITSASTYLHIPVIYQLSGG